MVRDTRPALRGRCKKYRARRVSYFQNEQGKTAVRKKGADWVARVQDVHRRYTTSPIVAGDHFAVGREVDITVEGHGRIKINELMVYQVKDGMIVMEQFIY